MNRRSYAAALAFQSPSPATETAISPVDVCPTCKCPTTAYRFAGREGVVITTHHCRQHGDVVPMRSAVANQAYCEGA